MIPNSVNTGAIVYKVLLIKDLLNDERSQKLTGLVSINDGTIKIEKGIDEQYQAMTLLHELIHHVMMVSGHDTDIPSQEATEDFIDALASGILTILRLNPEIRDMVGGLDND